jgi:hypothetical protein
VRPDGTEIELKLGQLERREIESERANNGDGQKLEDQAPGAPSPNSQRNCHRGSGHVGDKICESLELRFLRRVKRAKGDTSYRRYNLVASSLNLRLPARIVRLVIRQLVLPERDPV